MVRPILEILNDAKGERLYNVCTLRSNEINRQATRMNYQLNLSASNLLGSSNGTTVDNALLRLTMTIFFLRPCFCFHFLYKNADLLSF